MRYNGYSDEQLMQILSGYGRGQRSRAFDSLYDRYSRLLYRYFYHSLGRDDEKSKDFLHDLFLKILEHPGSFDGNRNFRPWIFSVAANMCKNEYRKMTVRSEHARREIRNGEENPAAEPVKKTADLREVFRNISEEHRTVIVMRFKMKMSIKEIADVLEIPEGTVKSRLYYSLRELRKYMNSQ